MPEFSDEDDKDGMVTRSYLRKVAAWRRMTSLRPNSEWIKRLRENALAKGHRFMSVPQHENFKFGGDVVTSCSSQRKHGVFG